jgi:hypothetical protein
VYVNMETWTRDLAIRKIEAAMSSNKDILTKEIESWGRFGNALREENRLLFGKMLSKCKKRKYASCVNVNGENFSTEALFLLLILEQQKMINELIAKLSGVKKMKAEIL